MANISSQLFVCWSVVTFSLPVKQQGVWKCQSAETPTYLSFEKVKNAVCEWAWGRLNQLYCFRATMIGLILYLILVFLTLPATCNCHPDPSTAINPKCIRLFDKHLRQSYTLLPLLSQPKHWWNVEISKGLVLVWCNTRRACYLLDLWLVWYQAFYSNDN